MSPEELAEKTRKMDTIIITGKPERCEAAKKALLDLVPITEEVSVPYDYHRFIIGQKGRDVRKMMQVFDVNISIPPPSDNSDQVKVSGAPENVARATQALQDKVVQLDAEKEDRALKSYGLQVEVDPRHHPKIIGRKGAVISKIRADHDVNIQFPDRQDENQNTITITGYQDRAERARDDIMAIVKDLEDMVTEEVSIDRRIHPRIIGGKGRTVRKIMEDYNVDVRFPRDSGDPDLVIITGPEDAVFDCKDHLLNLVEEYMQDVVDQEYLQDLQRPPSKGSEGGKGGGKGPAKGFVVSNAPWHAPDTASTDEFPSFGAPVAPKSGHAWGPRK